MFSLNAQIAHFWSCNFRCSLHRSRQPQGKCHIGHDRALLPRLKRAQQGDVRKGSATGWLVPHEVICEYNAHYRVSYEGREIYPPAADRLGIPLNEIWIIEKYRRYVKYILHHELEEIRYRVEGFNIESAHLRAMEGSKVCEKEEL